MSIGFVAIVMFLERTPPPPKHERGSIVEPLRALRHRATRGSGLTAVFYNFGFFTLLAYTPFPLHLSIHQLGYTFTGWGLLLAIFAVFVAPRIGRRYGDIRGLGGALAAIVAILVLMGVLHASQTALIVCVVVSGAFLGITNTLMTQVVMESAPVPRPIASSAYSFVRFCGGAIAPFVAGKLGEHVSVQAPFYLGAGMTAIGIGVLWMYRHALLPAADVTALPLPTALVTPTTAGATPMVLAVGGPTSRQVSALAAPLARARGAAVHVLHVIETDVLAGEDTADLESPAAARALLEGCIVELRETGVPVTGELLHSYGTHTDVAAEILHRAEELGAGAIVLGPETRHLSPATSVNAYIAAHAPSHVIIVNPDAGALGRPSADAPARLRNRSLR
jgi:nucleotide-binding universal stress UspA family protein